MAIQMRRGLEIDFNPDKMKPGEWAVSLDSKYVRMCFAPGLCFRMATYESFEEDMQEIQNILTSVNTSATNARNSADIAQSNAALSKSYAVGGTGTREGEDTDNAKYYYEQAKAVTNVDIATTDKAGIVKPDGTSVTVDPDGKIHANTKALSDIGDVDIQNPLDKQALVYDAASGKWKNGQGSVSSVISDEWNASITYAVGQYCIHNNILWKCLVANTNIEPTEGTYWTKVSVANEIAAVNSSLSDVNKKAFQNAYMNGVIENALLLDIGNVNNGNNNPKIVTADETINMPSDCAWGVREVSVINSSMAVARITGVKTDGTTPKTWTGCYNYGNWTVWS